MTTVPPLLAIADGMPDGGGDRDAVEDDVGALAERGASVRHDVVVGGVQRDVGAEPAWRAPVWRAAGR